MGKHSAIDPEIREQMNQLGRRIDAAFNREHFESGGLIPRRIGFALLMFKLDQNDGKMNYLSNRKREDMIEALKEFIAKFEG